MIFAKLSNLPNNRRIFTFDTIVIYMNITIEEEKEQVKILLNSLKNNRFYL